QVLHELGDSSPVGFGIVPALEHRVWGGDGGGRVAHGHADSAAAEVEAENAHAGRGAYAGRSGGRGPSPAWRRASSRAASRAEGSRPPAMASSGFLPPPPPPTSRAGPAMSCGADRPLSGRTAATSATPPPSGTPPSTTARTPGWSRTATARSRRASRVLPSR